METRLITLTINNKTVNTDLDPDTPLLWFIRDELALTGTKFGCGKGLCGACTVHFNHHPVRSCSLPISAIGNGIITTIEGEQSEQMTALKAAWLKYNVPQCGYCQIGQLMSASALLAKITSPNEEDINNAMSGNICRCGTYTRIKQGIFAAAEKLAIQVK